MRSKEELELFRKLNDDIDNLIIEFINQNGDDFIPKIVTGLLSYGVKLAVNTNCPDDIIVCNVTAILAFNNIGKGRINWEKLNNDIKEKLEV